MRKWIALGGMLSLAACSGETSDGADAGNPSVGDGGADAGMMEACSTEGTGTLSFEVEIPSGVAADVRASSASGDPIEGGTITASRNVEVAAGEYSVSAHRVRAAGDIVGEAYQAVVHTGDTVCVRDGETTTVHVVYTREPGSAKLWATNVNADAQIVAFDADALAAAGTQAPSVTLDGKLTSPSALAVDGLGRLWIGERTGRVVSFVTDRLGETSTEGPDVVLEGDALCGPALPCGPRALAFDRDGALWVATLERIVKLAPESLAASGEPEPEVTITSPDVTRPMSLAFDADGNLWVGDDDTSAIVEFTADRLTGDIADGAGDVVITAQTPPPVIGPLRGPEGLAFDAENNLWVGYFAGNNLARFTPSERTTSGTITPEVQFVINVLALVTGLAIDESGNLWMPGAQGSIYRIDAAELMNEQPALTALESDALGSIEKLTLNTVAGPTFIAP